MQLPEKYFFEPSLESCAVNEDLFTHINVLNQKLNILSPTRLDNPEAVAEVHQLRAGLLAAFKRHTTRGHDGKPCPAGQSPSRFQKRRVD
jgi:hypothetical protein